MAFLISYRNFKCHISLKYVSDDYLNFSFKKFVKKCPVEFYPVLFAASLFMAALFFIAHPILETKYSNGELCHSGWILVKWQRFASLTSLKHADVFVANAR